MTTSLERLLGRQVDRVGADARAQRLAQRSIKRASKLAALERAVALCDLTTLEGADTAGRVRRLAAKAVDPDPAAGAPPVAAVCVYPNLVAVAKEAVAGSGVRVASVATGFPAGQTPLVTRLEETRQALSDGADEIDMVISRNAFLAGREDEAFAEVCRVKEICGDAHLKVILETGELDDYSQVRRATLLACQAGADFVKTSTGKISPAATLGVTLVMLEAVRDFEALSDRQIGIKPAGGIRTAKQAIAHLVLVQETLGPQRLVPELYRLGASTLLDDLLLQLRAQRQGAYAAQEYLPYG